MVQVKFREHFETLEMERISEAVCGDAEYQKASQTLCTLEETFRKIHPEAVSLLNSIIDTMGERACFESQAAYRMGMSDCLDLKKLLGGYPKEDRPNE